MPTHAHRTLRNTDLLIWFDEKPTEKPTEKYSVSVSVLFCLNRPKPTDVWGKTENPTEPLFTFGSQHCCYTVHIPQGRKLVKSTPVCMHKYVPGTYVRTYVRTYEDRVYTQ